MHNNPLRTDKICLNCGHQVENRFCSNCGQENIDTRKTFFQLFVHFFEDLTHYENAFWKTIKNLLLKPSSLTKEYLSGKRLSYLAPVRLYIFISFVTFFLVTIIPNPEGGLVHVTKNSTTTNDQNKIISSTPEKKMDVEEYLKSEEAKDSLKNIKEEDFINVGYKSEKQFDSIQSFAKSNQKVSPFEGWFYKRILHIKDHYSKVEIIEKCYESIIHNFPKVLMIYMPLFAFFLWLFHGKKKWFYFDHGIFTLHYFSFLLLIYLSVFILVKLLSIFGNFLIINWLTSIVKFVSYLWMFYYFFPAHHRFYGESRGVSFVKSSILFFINMFFILIILLLFILYSFLNIH